MPVIPINTPNLAADIVQMAAFVSAIIAGAPNTLNTYFNPCWSLKPTGDCSALILTDETDYQAIGVVDLNDVLISSTFGLLSDCGCEIISDGCPPNPLLPNSVTTYDQLAKDGTYCTEIEVSYTVIPVGEFEPVTFTETIKVAYESDCCEKKYRALSYNIWGKMSDISCDINCLMKVGRNIKNLKKSYLELSNLLWLYYHSIDSCYESDKVFCIFNKIK